MERSSSGCIHSASQPIPGENFLTNKIDTHSGFRALCACARHGIRQSVTRFSSSGAGGWVPGHCYSVPYMKIPAKNQVIFIKNVVAWLYTDRVGYGGGGRCPGSTTCATTTGPRVDIPSAIQGMSRR